MILLAVTQLSARFPRIVSVRPHPAEVVAPHLAITLLDSGLHSPSKLANPTRQECPEIGHSDSQNLYRQRGDQHILQTRKRKESLCRSGENVSDTYVLHHVRHHVISRFLRIFDLHDKTGARLLREVQ